MICHIMQLNGAMLINARHRRGLNQDQVAAGTRLSRYTIWKAEHGSDVHPNTGKRICEFLDLNLADTVIPVERTKNGDAA